MMKKILPLLFPSISDEAFLLIHMVLRKAAHVTEYFVLSLLLFRAIRAGSFQVNTPSSRSSALLCFVTSPLQYFGFSMVLLSAAVKGVPVDTLEVLEERRGVPLTVDKTSHHKGLDWNILREKVKRGMRNATLMAVAPNATIGLVAGTVPGIDGRFAQVFSRNTLSGKYLDLNHNLVRDLTNLGIWEDVREKIIANQGDISSIEEIPKHVRDIYKTSFTTSPYAYVEVAARAQKWIDQALSRNIYLESRDIDEMIDLYSTAWRKGLKSTYYLHMKPRHTAEQSTIAVNKAVTIGKKGFGAISNLGRMPEFKVEPVPAPVVEPVAIPEVVIAVAPVKEPVPVGRPVQPQLTVHGPENPADANVCFTCQ